VGPFLRSTCGQRAGWLSHETQQALSDYSRRASMIPAISQLSTCGRYLLEHDLFLCPLVTHFGFCSSGSYLGFSSLFVPSLPLLLGVLFDGACQCFIIIYYFLIEPIFLAVHISKLSHVLQLWMLGLGEPGCIWCHDKKESPSFFVLGGVSSRHYTYWVKCPM
jgi:hypothetical protein